MTITITGKSSKKYTFEGGYTTTNQLLDKSGIYAIIDNLNNKLSLIDVGESAQVKTRIENHDRKTCWNGKKQGTLECAVLYTSKLHQQGRISLEQDIRNNYPNLCGDR